MFFALGFLPFGLKLVVLQLYLCIQLPRFLLHEFAEPFTQ